MAPIQLLIETPTDTTEYAVEYMLQTNWAVVVETITSMHTFKGKKFWVTVWPSRKVYALLNQLKHETVDSRYWKVSRVKDV